MHSSITALAVVPTQLGHTIVDCIIYYPGLAASPEQYLNYSLDEDNCMLNASCTANVNEVCAISYYSVSSSNSMTSMNQNESVILDLNKAVSYFFEFTGTYQNIRILLKANYSNCKLLLFFFLLHEL